MILRGLDAGTKKKQKKGEDWRLFLLLCLVSAYVIAVVSLLIRRKPRWIAVFGNLVDNLNNEGKITM